MDTPTTVLLDIDGVLVVSWEPIEGAVGALAELRAAGHPIRFLTNTTSRSRAQIASLLGAGGFELDESEVFTATAAAAAHLRSTHPGARCLFLNSGDVSDDLRGVTIVDEQTPPDQVDVVLVGGAGPEFGYEALNHALSCLLSGAALVAAHRNTVWRTSSGLQLDAGPYVGALESASGVSAVVVGKPAPAMFAAALGSVVGRGPAVVPGSAVMVGDDRESDVRGAQRAGVTGILVHTGKFRPAPDDRGPEPDAEIESVAELPAWIAAHT